jgi:hypothetical protein
VDTDIQPRVASTSHHAVAVPADNALVDIMWERGVATAAALRALPAPRVPPPGPLDAVIGILLARAAPFDQATQLALRRQQGWGTAAPQPITEIRSHGRWKATAALTRLTATSAPPSLLAAMHLLEEVAPCPSGDAAAALIKAGVTNTPIHPGGALTLARWYGVTTALRLESGAEGRTTVVGRATTATRAATHRILTAAGRAGWVDLGRLRADNATSYGRPTDYAILGDARLHRTGEVVVRVDDRGSGLSGLVVRMLVASPRPLTLGELYEGLQRRWRFRRRLLPSPSTFAAWVATQPWLSHGLDETVGLSGELTPNQRNQARSGGTWQLAGEVADGASATWAQLIGALTATEILAETAKMAAHTSPILVHTGPNTYRLRGSF